MVTRTEFIGMLDGLFDEIKTLFAKKNESYGTDDDLFYNKRLYQQPLS